MATFTIHPKREKKWRGRQSFVHLDYLEKNPVMVFLVNIITTIPIYTKT
jgi:hypothetical protein